MSAFRDKLLAADIIAATWVKTPSPIIVEVLSLSSLDCLVLDAEHAPFDRTTLDLCILAARAYAKPVLVRPASSSHEQILNALDCGADGVVLPHIRSAEEAGDAVKACHYGRGGRGFAGSSRSAGYTTKGMANHLETSKSVIVIAQIEDVEAVDNIDAICRVEGIDALFIGRADLTVAYGAASSDDEIVVKAVEKIVAAGKAAGRVTGMFLSRASDVALWRDKGASLFVLGSDHDFLLQGAATLGQAIRG